MGATASAREGRGSSPPAWTSERIPKLDGDYWQVPNALSRLNRKLDGMDFKVAYALAASTFGGVDRPRFVRYTLDNLALNVGTTKGVAAISINHLVELGVIERRDDGTGRGSWYAINLSTAAKLPDREKQAPRKPPVREASMDERPPSRRENFSAHTEPPPAPQRAVTPTPAPIEASSQVGPGETVEIVAKELVFRYVNDGPVPIDLVTRYDRSLCETRFKAVVENTGDARRSVHPQKTPTPAEFACWLENLWTESGLAEKCGGIWPDEAVTRRTYEALDGASLDQFALHIRRKASQIKSPGFLPHLAKTTAENRHKWDGKAKRTHDQDATPADRNAVSNSAIDQAINAMPKAQREQRLQASRTKAREILGDLLWNRMTAELREQQAVGYLRRMIAEELS